MIDLTSTPTRSTWRKETPGVRSSLKNVFKAVLISTHPQDLAKRSLYYKQTWGSLYKLAYKVGKLQKSMVPLIQPSKRDHLYTLIKSRENSLKSLEKFCLELQNKVGSQESLCNMDLATKRMEELECWDRKISDYISENIKLDPLSLWGSLYNSQAQAGNFHKLILPLLKTKENDLTWHNDQMYFIYLIEGRAKWLEILKLRSIEIENQTGAKYNLESSKISETGAINAVKAIESWDAAISKFAQEHVKSEQLGGINFNPAQGTPGGSIPNIIAKLSEENEKLTKDLKNAEEDLEKTKSNYGDIDADYMKLGRKYLYKQKEISELRHLVVDEVLKREESEKEANELKIKLEITEVQNQRILQSLGEANDEINKLNSVLEQTSDENIELKQQNAKLDGDLNNQNKDSKKNDVSFVAFFQEKLESFKKSLAKKEQEIASLYEILAEKDQKIASLDKTSAEKDLKIEKLANRVDYLEDRVEKLDKLYARFMPEEKNISEKKEKWFWK